MGANCKIHRGEPSAGGLSQIARRVSVVQCGMDQPEGEITQPIETHAILAAPAERYNPDRCGSSNAIGRQDWRRGPQDCALHFKPLPPVEQAARLAMSAVTPAEPHNPELCGSSKRHPPPRLAPWPARLRAPLPRVARRTARFTSSCPFFSHLRVLRVLRGLSFSVSSVPSVLLARRFFSAREDFSAATGVSCPRDDSRHACLVAALPRCGLPSPCPPWFAFSVPSHPQSQRSPNLFSFPFQPLPNSPFLLLLLPSCMLKVKGAADALVGARTADGESPGQQRRRPQPLPSPDGGELRSLKPAAGGEQAGGGLLT